MKRYKSHKTPQEILQRGITRLPNLLKKTREIAELNKILTVILNQSMLPHCYVANFDKNSVTIFTDEPSCSTYIHFHAKEIAKQFQSCGLTNIKTVRSKTRPPISQNKTRLPEAIQRQLSEKTCQLLTDTAEIIEHSKLKNALEKLARHRVKL